MHCVLAKSYPHQTLEGQVADATDYTSDTWKRSSATHEQRYPRTPQVLYLEFSQLRVRMKEAPRSRSCHHTSQVTRRANMANVCQAPSRAPAAGQLSSYNFERSSPQRSGESQKMQNKSCVVYNMSFMYHEDFLKQPQAIVNE